MESKKITPLFFFLSLGTVVSLITTVTALLNLSFEALNHALPDVLTDTYQYGYVSYSFDAMRVALSILIIIVPVYLILERFWSMAGRDERLFKGNEILRRWAIYLILFLASIVLLTDLITLVKYFVSGEVTTRFLLKVAITLIVAVKIGYYYVRVLIAKDFPRWRMVYHIGWILLSLAIIIWSFTVMGSPFNQRTLRIDQRRIDDLQSIQWQVISYWQQKGKLPSALTDLSSPISGYTIPQDPEFQSGKAYEYSIHIDPNVRMTAEAVAKIKTFDLCATFALPIPKGYVPNQGGGIAYPMTATRDAAVSAVAPYPGGINDSWDHEAGHTCFTRTIDPDMYPPYPKPAQ